MTDKEISKKELEDKISELTSIKRGLRRNFHDLINLLTATISLYNRFLGSHIKRVALLSKSFAQEMKYDKDTVYLVYYAGLLHDVGMVGMPERVIAALPKELDKEETAQYRQHPLISQRIVETVYDFKRVAAVVRSHHEDYNGTGFPDGLLRKEIPLGARILRLVNDYDLLLYKSRKGHQEAVEILREGGGPLYDPELADRFCGYLKKNAERYEQKPSLVSFTDLKEGMFINEDVILPNGLLLLPKGIILDRLTLKKIASFRDFFDDSHKIEVIA